MMQELMDMFAMAQALHAMLRRQPATLSQHLS